MPVSNQNLHTAKVDQADEFYTLMPDIKNEISNYTNQFAGKVVYLNCDDPNKSNFFRFFNNHFSRLKLKRLICTHFIDQQQSLFQTAPPAKPVCLQYTGGTRYDIRHLKGDGDFRSNECERYFDAADIVVTNPPFSIMRQFLTQLLKSDKKFLVIGTINAIVVKCVMPHFAAGEIWPGVTRPKKFIVPEHYRTTDRDADGRKVAAMGNTIWITNMEHGARSRPILYNHDRPIESYERYDNYDAINVDTMDDVPANYYGKMGLPANYIFHYNPDEYRVFALDSILGFSINGREVFRRIITQKKPASELAGLGGNNMKNHIS